MAALARRLERGLQRAKYSVLNPVEDCSPGHVLCDETSPIRRWWHIHAAYKCCFNMQTQNACKLIRLDYTCNQAWTQVENLHLFAGDGGAGKLDSGSSIVAAGANKASSACEQTNSISRRCILPCMKCLAQLSSKWRNRKPTPLYLKTATQTWVMEFMQLSPEAQYALDRLSLEDVEKAYGTSNTV